MTIFKEILKASRNNQASIFAFTFKFKIAMYIIICNVHSNMYNVCILYMHYAVYTAIG